MSEDKSLEAELFAKDMKNILKHQKSHTEMIGRINTTNLSRILEMR